MIGIGIGLWLIAPIAAVVVLSILSSQQSLVNPTERVWAEARQSQDSVSTPVDVILTWDVPEPLRAPNWGGGLVQRVLVSPGDEITDATEIVRVDGLTILTVRSAEPFYRPISRGDRGDDVRALNDFLTRNGFAAVEGDVASASTVAGVRALGERIGLQNTSVFDPGWVVHMRVDSIRVATVELTQGARAPALGEPIVTVSSVLGSATVVPWGTFLNAPTGAQIPPDPDEISRRALTVPVGQELQFGGQEIRLADTRFEVSVEGLSAIADSVPVNTVSIQANQVRAPVGGDVVVPAAAIFASATGKTCVVVESLHRAVVVEVVADVGGSAVIRGDVEPGDRVQVRAQGADRRCS